MRHCKHCGYDESQHAQSCDRCGHPLDTTSVTQMGHMLDFTLYIGRDRIMMPFPANGRLVMGRASSSLQTTVLTSPTEREPYLSLLGDKPLVFRYFLEFLSLTSFEADVAGV